MSWLILTGARVASACAPGWGEAVREQSNVGAHTENELSERLRVYEIIRRGDTGARRAAAMLGCMLAGVLVAGCANARAASGPQTPQPGQPVPASAIPRLTTLAERVVKTTGDHRVEWASVVVTTHAKALTSATPGDLVPGDTHTVVYLLTMKGYFVGYLASVPRGARLPTGTYFSLVMDAHTFGQLDYGIGPKPPPVDPASLGPPTFLKLS